MTIPLKNDFPNVLPDRLRGRREGYGIAPSGSGSRAGDDFAGLFMDALRTGRANGEGDLIPPVPDKEQLRKLITRIELQMYEHLLGSLGNERSAESPGLLAAGGGLTTRWLFPPGALTSINRQKTPENDSRQAEDRFAPLIERAARTYGVDGALIRGVIRAESDFNPRALSSRGAVGLMQLMPATARELGVADPYDPAANIMGGTRYLKGLLDRYDGDVTLALAAYNWGMGNVERSPASLPVETRNYIARVSRYYRAAKA